MVTLHSSDAMLKNRLIVVAVVDDVVVIDCDFEA